MEHINLRPREAAKYLNISMSSLYRLQKTDKDFPQPKRLSERTIIYPVSELKAYIQSKGGVR